MASLCCTTMNAHSVLYYIFIGVCVCVCVWCTYQLLWIISWEYSGSSILWDRGM